MQSYKRRYPRGSPEANVIIEYTRRKGKYEGQSFAGIKDWIAWENWLEYATGDRNFGIYPTEPEDPRTDSELLRAKAICAFNKLLDALDTIAEGEAGKLEAERRLKIQLWRYLEAKRRIEQKPCEVT